MVFSCSCILFNKLLPKVLLIYDFFSSSICFFCCYNLDSGATWKLKKTVLLTDTVWLHHGGVRITKKWQRIDLISVEPKVSHFVWVTSHSLSPLFIKSQWVGASALTRLDWPLTETPCKNGKTLSAHANCILSLDIHANENRTKRLLQPEGFCCRLLFLKLCFSASSHIFLTHTHTCKHGLIIRQQAGLGFRLTRLWRVWSADAQRHNVWPQINLLFHQKTLQKKTTTRDSEST